jgi:hypothetical protein
MLRHSLVVLVCLLLSAAALPAADSGVVLQGVVNPNPNIVVNPVTDRIIAQVVDGGSWQTSFFLTNLDPSKTIYWALDFRTNGGGVASLPIVGTGSVTRVFASLPPNWSVVVDTLGTAANLAEGWALLTTYDRSADDPAAMVTTDKIGGNAIFRQRIAGRLDFEAVVPISPINETKVVLPFDNRNNYSTGIAILNPDPNNPATVQVAAYSIDGMLVRQDFFVLPPGNKQVFSMPDRYAEARGRNGRLNISTSGTGLSVLGLRFNPGGAFTSTHALSTP